MIFKKNTEPLLVHVHDDRYDCYGDPDSPRQHYLFKILTDMGGINESVEDGHYHFNVRRRGLKFVASLDPAPQG